MRTILSSLLIPFALLAQAPAEKGIPPAISRDIEKLNQLADKIRKDCPHCLEVDRPGTLSTNLPQVKSTIIALELDTVSRQNLTTTNALLRDAILLLGVSPDVLDKHSAGLTPAALAHLRANMLLDLLRAQKRLGGAK